MPSGRLFLEKRNNMGSQLKKGIVQVVSPCTLWMTAVVREITLHKHTRRKLAMNNHNLGYSWQTDNMLGGWALYTPHVSYYTLLIMNDLTQVHQGKNHNANEIHDQPQQLQVESIACLLYIHYIHWDNTAIIIDAISAGTHLMSPWLILVPHYTPGRGKIVPRNVM